MRKLFAFLLIILCAESALAEPLQDKEYVVLLHGIARSSSHMELLAEYLQKEGFEVINLDYPSTKYTLDRLVDVINDDLSTKGVSGQTTHFVGYSMGGILTRALVHKHRPEKLGKVVQLAPPNNGSEVADFLKNNLLYQSFYGPAGQELTTDNGNTATLLGEVDYPLGVIAGNKSIDPISSVIIPDDDDGKVSVESTKIDGMKDHIVVEASHIFFPQNKEVITQTSYFLKHGKFNKKED